MAPFEQAATQVENTQAGSQQAAASANLMSEYMSSVPSLAKKIETTTLGDADTKHDLALTFENIYTSAGGGQAGTAAEDTFQKALNDQLKSDKSALHVDTVHSTGLFKMKQNGYAVVDDSNGAHYSSGVIIPERAEAQYKEGKADAAGDLTQRPTDAASKPVEPGKPADASIPKDSDFSFTDPKTEQAYIQAAGDASKAILNPALSPAEKQQGVIDAMNEVHVHDNLDLANFGHELGQKLGANAKVDTLPSVAMTFHGGISIDTGKGDTVAVPFKLSGGKLVSNAQ